MLRPQVQHPLGLGGRSCLSNVARESLSDQPEKAFHVGELSAFFLHLLVGRVLFEERLV